MIAASTHVHQPEATLTPIPADKFSWIMEGSGHSETETFYIHPKSGGIVLVQMAYSEVSYPAVAQVTVRASVPGLEFMKSYNHSASALKLTPDGFTCSDLKMTKKANAQDPNAIDFSLSMQNRDVMINLTGTTEGSAVRVGDGKTQFVSTPGSKPDGYLAQIFGLRSTVDGTLMANGVQVVLEGRSAFVHQYSGFAPYRIGQTWEFLTWQGENASLSTILGKTPKTFGGEHFSTLAVTFAGERHVATDVRVNFEGEQVDSNTGYAVPTVATVEANWRSADGDAMALATTLALDHKTMHCLDVLGQLPWLIRKAIQLLVSKPYVYQFVQNSDLVISRNGQEVFRETGHGLFEITFTNPA